MQTTQRTIRPAFLALFLILMAIPAHAGVYKWVDEKGMAHYTEQPPKKGGHAQLRVQAAPSQPRSESTLSSGLSSQQQAEQKRLNDISVKLKIERDLNAARDRVRAEQRQIDAQEADRRAASDKKLVDDCNRNHEVYCDKGADNVRKQKMIESIGR